MTNNEANYQSTGVDIGNSYAHALAVQMDDLNHQMMLMYPMAKNDRHYQKACQDIKALRQSYLFDIAKYGEPTE